MDFQLIFYQDSNKGRKVIAWNSKQKMGKVRRICLYTISLKKENLPLT